MTALAFLSRTGREAVAAASVRHRLGAEVDEYRGACRRRDRWFAIRERRGSSRLVGPR